MNALCGKGGERTAAHFNHAIVVASRNEVTVDTVHSIDRTPDMTQQAVERKITYS